MPTLVSRAKGQNLGIGKYMAKRLRAGDDTKQILVKVHKKFPDSGATETDVSIIRKKMRDGLL